MKALPAEVQLLLREAPPRLVRHLTLVHDTARRLTREQMRKLPPNEVLTQVAEGGDARLASQA